MLRIGEHWHLPHDLALCIRTLTLFRYGVCLRTRFQLNAKYLQDRVATAGVCASFRQIIYTADLFVK